MKFPSIKSLAEGALRVISRFPVEIAFALLGTIAATMNVMVKGNNAELSHWYWRLILSADLGLLLSLSASLYCQSKGIKGTAMYICKAAAVAITVLLFFVINPYKREDDMARFLLLSFSFHLLVSFAGFVGAGNTNGFWQFNKTLFLRFLSGVLYSIVLFLGLSAAIAALNFLFGFKFEWRTYTILWVWIVGMFNTLFVLAGIPADLQRLDHDESYPRSLKVFTQYVLIPLTTVYLAILLAYEIKIGLQQTLPKGYVSSLILCYAGFGILSLLLVYPIRNQDENKWIKSFSRSFYFFMLPLLVLLFLAIGTRVYQYGITTERYFIIVLAFWLVFISVYFLIYKKQNIRVIPLSLCVVIMLSTFGPQSAFDVSYVSQKNVIKNIFNRNDAFKNGILLPINERKISRNDAEQAISAFRYVISTKNLTSLQPYFKQDLQKVTDSLERGEDNDNRYLTIDKKLGWVKSHLGLWHINNSGAYIGRGYSEDGGVSGQNYNLSSSEQELLDVTGYKYVIDINSNRSDTIKYTLGATPAKVFVTNRDKCYLEIGGERIVFDVQSKVDSIAGLDLKKYANEKNSWGFTVPKDFMQLNKTSGNHKVTLAIKAINWVKESGTGKNKIIYIDGAFLINR